MGLGFTNEQTACVFQGKLEEIMEKLPIKKSRRAVL